jgi:hypothetical protein
MNVKIKEKKEMMENSGIPRKWQMVNIDGFQAKHPKQKNQKKVKLLAKKLQRNK